MSTAGEVKPEKRVKLSRRQQEAMTRLSVLCSIKRRIAIVRRRSFESPLPQVEDIVIRGESSEAATQGETYAIECLPIVTLEAEARIIEEELERIHSISQGEFYLMFRLDEEGLRRELKSMGSKPRPGAKRQVATQAVAAATV